MGRIVDTTNIPTPYELITQTPKNFTKENYYINELQEKIWQDWEYRPNRVDVEQEEHIGEEDYFPLEVVIQNIKTDKGEKVSDDYKRLVFREVDYQVRLGTHFRFSFKFDLEEPNENKNVWIATNKDSTIPTAGVVVTRCNGTLGSIYTDETGKSSYHYEPCIVTNNLNGVNFHYANEIVTPQSRTAIVLQHNKYTKDYYLNQRFIVGYDTVYKVTGFEKFNSLKTYDPLDVDLTVLYVEIDEKSARDNFETRIAFNKDGEENLIIPDNPVIENLQLRIVTPSPLPTDLLSKSIKFEVGLYNGDNMIDAPVSVTASLWGTPKPEEYYELVVESENSFVLRRKKVYTRAQLKVVCSVSSETSPNGTEYSQEFELSLKGWEE